MEEKEIQAILDKVSEANKKEVAGILETFKDDTSKEQEKKMVDAIKGVTGDFGGDDPMTLKELTDVMAKQGAVIDGLRTSKETKKTLAEALKANKENISKLAKGQSNEEVVVKADTVRASIASNTQSYNLPDIGQLAHRQLALYDIFAKFPVTESNNNGVIRYWDWDSATTVRAAAAIAESGTFPESEAKWALGTIPLEKIGDTLPVSEEFFEDEQMFAAELEQFLATNVELAIDTQLATGNGTTPNLKGIVTTVNAYTPVASGITDANIYDLLVKVSESITTTGGAKYRPDVALMNISDINKMKLKKDANNNYIIPPFVSRDGKQVDTMIVMEANSITANTMVVGDRRFARIYEKGGITLSKGLSGTQFVEDMMTLKARKRLAFLIRNADLGGFAKVTSISAALTTLAS